MRVKGGTVTRKRHKRMLKAAEGFRGRRSRCYKLAKRSVQKAGQHAFRGRRRKKRDFRGLWIVRINAAARMSGLSYSRFIRGVQQASIELDRKALAELAIHDPGAFAAIVEKAKAALAQ